MAEKLDLVPLSCSRESLQLAALQEISEVIASNATLSEILETINKSAFIAFDASSSWIMLEKRGSIKTVASRGENNHILKKLRANPGQGLIGRIWDQGKVEVVLARSLINDDIFAALVKKKNALILIPFGKKGERLGILGCVIPEKLAVSVKFLIALAGQAGMGIEKSGTSWNIKATTHERLSLQEKIDLFATEEEKRITRDILLSDSPAMAEVFRLVKKVNASPFTPVLLEGESGTGKELIANLIHYGTRERKQSPFLKINCASFSENLLESEIFGHEKGAFTDAKEKKNGLLEIAHHGTLFLDEISEMNLKVQAKLLRVLETFCFKRVGGIKDIQVEFRLVAATNRDLKAAIKEGKFRLDFFYRFNVITIAIPPLRERKEDIVPLAEFFLKMFNKRLKKNITEISPAAREMLITYSYPGNIRELKNIIERGVIMETETVIHPESLALPPVHIEDPDIIFPNPSSSIMPSLPQINPRPPTKLPSLRQIEREYVERVLGYTQGNKTKAAKLLGVSYPTLDKKIKDYGISSSLKKLKRYGGNSLAPI